MVSREIREGLQLQGKDERIVYSITTTPWGSSPADVVVLAYDTSASPWMDVSDVVLDGTASVNGDVITLPAVQGLTAGHSYRIAVRFAAGGNIFECYLQIKAEA